MAPRTKTATGFTRSDSLATQLPQPQDKNPKPGEDGPNKFVQQGPTAPAISLPKGGGAIRGMGEKLSTNPATGTATAAVPIPVSAGRGGHGPGHLELSYSGGSGNGPWGIGWSLEFGAVTRKTDKGLPRYDDDDVFIINGSEDLVPRFRTNDDGTLVTASGPEGHQFVLHVDQRDGWVIRRFAPRVESKFARIEMWTNEADPGDIHWKSTAADGLVTLFGLDDSSRIRDGAGKRIFSWLLCQTHDTKGNCAVYTYKREDSVGVDIGAAHEANRTPGMREAHLYAKSVKYGNRIPNRNLSTWTPFDARQLPDNTWMFEVVLDYGEHDPDNPLASDNGPRTWPCRQDPVSNCRATFETRMYRLCRRILMFHHFPDELGRQDCLISSTSFVYDENPVATTLTKVVRTGYQPLPATSGNTSATYASQSLPPLEFEYSRLPTPAELETTLVRALGEESIQGLPVGFSGSYQSTDLDGEGLGGVLFESDDAWYYKRNVSANNYVLDSEAHLEPLFLPPVILPKKPNASLDESFQLLSLEGNGQLDVVNVASASTAGYYERAQEGGGWEAFRTFQSFPNINFTDANAKLVDLTGDGLADILIAESERVVWYQSIGEKGFLAGQTVPLSVDEDKGPRVLFSDPEHTILLADMSGDGMQDLVRVSNPGCVCYWPGLGYGQFGAKVTMSNATPLDRPDMFDPKRIRFVDIDGNGTSDMIYLGADRVRVFRNQSGNSWSAPQVMTAVPGFDNLTSVQPMDLFGKGTMCLVWSTPVPSQSRRPVYYVDLMDGVKPHLLMGARNNVGAETRYSYTPSTEFYLNDEMAGKPWMTKIPFPVHCVSKMEVYDHVSHSKFVTKYAYKHGYYDGIEREFRGFALAEQWDTEQHESFDSTGADVVNWDAAFIGPPVYTKQFYHTGAYLGGEDLGVKLAQEFYKATLGSEGNTAADLISAHALANTFPDAISPDDMREACRALKGLPLRQEVYCQDGSPLSGIPFSVSSYSYTSICLQPKALNALHSSWISHPRDAITVEYDREATDDPRITHTMSLEQNRFAADSKSLSIAYGRIRSDLTGHAKSAQEKTIITYTEQDYTNFVDDADGYVMSVPLENRVYELSGLSLPPGSRFFRWSDLAANNFEAIQTLPAIPSEEVGDRNESWKRLLHRQRIFYRRDNLAGVLPLGQVQSLILTSHSESLAYTPGMMSKFQSGSGTLIRDVRATMRDAGYVDAMADSHWWVPSGRQFHHPLPEASADQELAEARSHFFYSRRFEDNLGFRTVVNQDAHSLLPVTVIDHIGNITKGDNDYRALQPHTVTDINGNQTQVSFDAFMRVVGSAVMGRPGEGLGDSLTAFSPDLSDQDRADFFENPSQDIARRLLGTASSRIIYDNNLFHRDPTQKSPAYEATIARETHVSDSAAGRPTRLRIKFTYSDGFGREIQEKTVQEPGPLKPGGPLVASRWVGSGWKIFNNKGNEVQQYEPFFDDTHKFKFAKIEGVSSIILYDAAQRAAVTLRPDHAWSKNVYGGWSQKIYDTGDVVLVSDPRADPDVGTLFRGVGTGLFLPSWYDARRNGAKGRLELDAAEKAASYHDTPTVTYADAMGRPFMTTIDNGLYGKYTEMSVLDMDGNKARTVDSLGRTTQTSDYNLVGHCYHGTSMDTGESWTLCNVQDNRILDWDTRGHRLRTEYDGLQRVKAHFLIPPGSGAELMVDRIVYGDEANLPPSHNARGKHYKQYDQSGVVTMASYDFKGNLLVQEQQLCANYKATIDWTAIDAVALEPEVHRSRSSYDALNRHIDGTSPDDTLTVNEYNEAGFVERMRVNSRGERDPSTNQPIFKEYVTNVDYDAQGRRTTISYGNGTTSTYEYDPVTSNLTKIHTASSSGTPVQSLSYTYDIAGNVVHIDDAVQQAVFFRNQVADSGTDCSYDPIGRLIEFRGRERLGENSAPGPQDMKPSGLGGIAPNAVGMYTETYTYDAANNILSVKHSGSQATNPGWTRRYSYDDASQLEPSSKSNKLTSTVVGNTTETYGYAGLEGRAGLMTSMSHLSVMAWDFRDNLASTAAQVVRSEGGAVPETTYYVYDATGRRTRKVTERHQSGDDPDAPPRKLKETLYLTGLDIYRKFAGDGVTITLERQTFKATHADKNVALLERRTVSAAAEAGETNNLPPERLDRYQLDDHLSSIQIELDDVGNPISYEEYSAYGTTTYSATKTELHIDKRYRHANKERDRETGLYCYGQRYYAPWIGRWVSSDPAGSGGDGLNLFCFVRCNPVRYRDSGGTESKDWRDDLSWFQRQALKVDDWINEHPTVKGVVDNLEKRGEALNNLPKALGELAEKPAGEIVETLANGMVQFGKDTVKAVGDTGKYGYKAFTEGGDENWRKFGHAATDVVLNGADIGLMVAGGAGAAKGAVNMGRALKAGGEAALESAKATTKALGRTIAEGAQSAPARAPALIAGNSAAMMMTPEALLGETANMMMRSAKTVYKGVKGAASAGGKAFKTTRKMQKLESAIKKLETGSSKLSKQYRAFKNGGQLAEKAPITMEEALRKVGGKAKGLLKNARHHDAPQTLQKLFDALEYDNHTTTYLMNRRVHQLVHGMGGYFHDSNVLWAYKLSQTDLRALTHSALDAIRKEINATYGTAITEAKPVVFK